MSQGQGQASLGEQAIESAKWVTLSRIVCEAGGFLSAVAIARLLTPSEYGQRALDSHAAFLLSRVDGMLTIDDLMTVSGMPMLETHRHLCNLLRQGILTLR